MASLTESLRLVISGDSSGATSALRSVRDDMGKTEAAAGSWGQKMNTAANYAAAGVVALGAVIVKSTTALIGFGEEVDSISDISNLGAEGSSRLAGQFKAFGIEAQTGAQSVKFFEKNLDAARQGNEAMAESFARLGISAGELRSLTDADLLGKVRDGIAETGDATEQTAIAMKLFGRSGAELSDWYAAAPDDMAKVNEQLEKAGLVWGDKEVKTWQDVIDVQREMKIQWLGLQITIARDVMPALRPLISAFVSLLHALRPLMPLIVPLTAALATFVGVVKTALVIRQMTAATRAFFAAVNLGKLGSATGLFGRLGGMLPSLTQALMANAAQWGAIGIAAGGAAIAIMKAWGAAQQYRDAMDQVESQTNANLTAIDKLIAKYKEMGRDTSGLERQRQQIIDDSKVSTPWVYYMNPVYTVIDIASRFADGGTVTRPTLALIGEGGEDEDVVPASKRGAYARGILGGGRTVYVDMRGSQYSSFTPRELEEQLGKSVRIALGGLA